MKHQYFLQKENGVRITISKEQTDICLLSKRFFVLIRTGFMTVIRMEGKSRCKPEPHLKYGGHNPHHPMGIGRF